jgi:hypothetical protein
MFNKGCICWWKEFERYQNARYNNKKKDFDEISNPGSVLNLKGGWNLILVRIGPGARSVWSVLLTRLRAGRIGVRIPVRIRGFSVHQNFQTGREVYPAACSVGTEVPSRLVHEVKHFHLVSRLRMSGAMPLLPYTPSWRGLWHLHLYCIGPLKTNYL